MTEIKNLETYVPDNITEAGISAITNRMKEASDSLYHTSKEKYNLKARLIEEADDMTTKEKLDALDQNYDRHNQEVRQGMIVFGVVSLTSLTLIGIAAGNPTITKNIRRLVLFFPGVRHGCFGQADCCLRT